MNALDLVLSATRPLKTLCAVPDDLDAVTIRGEEARPAEVGASSAAVERLWEAVEPHLSSDDEGVIARLLYGREEKGGWASRAGVYLGWCAAARFLARHGPKFGASPDEVLAERPTQG